MVIRFGRNDVIDTKELAQLVEDSKEENASGGTQDNQVEQQ